MFFRGLFCLPSRNGCSTYPTPGKSTPNRFLVWVASFSCPAFCSPSISYGGCNAHLLPLRHPYRWRFSTKRRSSISFAVYLSLQPSGSGTILKVCPTNTSLSDSYVSHCYWYFRPNRSTRSTVYSAYTTFRIGSPIR